jgi:hypothetical protein
MSKYQWLALRAKKIQNYNTKTQNISLVLFKHNPHIKNGENLHHDQA